MKQKQSEKDERVSEYISRWNQLEDFNDGGDDRQGRYVETELNRISEALGMHTNAVVQVAMSIYNQTRERDLIQGRNIDEVIGACLYLSSKVNDSGVTPDDISDMSSISRSKVMKTSKYIMKELGDNLPIDDRDALGPSSPKSFVNRFVNEINEERYQKDQDILGDDVVRRAEDIIGQCEDESIVSGKSPSGFAAAAIYLAGRQLDYSVTQAQIASVLDVTEVTIRQRYQEQEKVWNR